MIAFAKQQEPTSTGHYFLSLTVWINGIIDSLRTCLKTYLVPSPHRGRGRVAGGRKPD